MNNRATQLFIAEYNYSYTKEVKTDRTVTDLYNRGGNTQSNPIQTVMKDGN